MGAENVPMQQKDALRWREADVRFAVLTEVRSFARHLGFEKLKISTVFELGPSHNKPDTNSA
jgi:hypothetical protein